MNGTIVFNFSSPPVGEVRVPAGTGMFQPVVEGVIAHASDINGRGGVTLFKGKPDGEGYNVGNELWEQTAMTEGHVHQVSVLNPKLEGTVTFTRQARK